MVTSVGGDVTGELIRWIWKDEEISYEAHINGFEEHGGICDAADFDVDSLADIAKVANDLRYMWDAVLEPDTRGDWSIWGGWR
jgi:hypothetical protein